MKKFSREIAVSAVAVLAGLLLGCAAAPAGKPPYPCELAGSVWVPAVPRKGAYLEFTADRRAVGSTGPNRYFAPVKCAPGKRIRVSPVAYTKLRGELDEWEMRFFQALDDTRGYVFDGDKLTLYSEERQPLLELKMLRAPRKADQR